MPKPKYHLFVCGQTRPEGHPKGSCGNSGAARVFQTFGATLTNKRLLDKVALTQAGCIGPCQLGVNVLVYPEGVMYSEVTPDDVAAIVEQHFINGEPVAEKLTPAQFW